MRYQMSYEATYWELSQCQFCDIEIDVRDDRGRPIPFQDGVVTATLYFRQRQIL